MLTWHYGKHVALLTDGSVVGFYWIDNKPKFFETLATNGVLLQGSRYGHTYVFVTEDLKVYFYCQSKLSVIDVTPYILKLCRKMGVQFDCVNELFVDSSEITIIFRNCVCCVNISLDNPDRDIRMYKFRANVDLYSNYYMHSIARTADGHLWLIENEKVYLITQKYSWISGLYQMPLTKKSFDSKPQTKKNVTNIVTLVVCSSFVLTLLSDGRVYWMPLFAYDGYNPLNQPGLVTGRFFRKVEIPSSSFVTEIKANDSNAIALMHDGTCWLFTPYHGCGYNLAPVPKQIEFPAPVDNIIFTFSQSENSFGMYVNYGSNKHGFYICITGTLKCVLEDIPELADSEIQYIPSLIIGNLLLRYGGDCVSATIVTSDGFVYRMDRKTDGLPKGKLERISFFDENPLAGTKRWIKSAMSCHND